MAGSVVSGGTAYVASGSVTAGAPTLSGFVAGDWTVLACHLTASTGTITAPTGYTALIASTTSASSTSSTHAVFIRKWVSGDTNSPSVTCTSGRLTVLPLRVSGADPTTLTEASAVNPNSATPSSSVVAPSVSAVSSRLLVCAFAARSAVNGESVTPFSTPSGMTKVAEASSAPAAQSTSGIMVATQVIAATGATGTRSSVAASTSGSTTPIASSFLIVETPTGVTKSLAGSVAGSSVAGRVVGKRPTGSVSAAASALKRLGDVVSVYSDDYSDTYDEQQTGRQISGQVAGVGVKLLRSPRSFPASITVSGFMQRGYPRSFLGSLTPGAVVTRGPRKGPVGSILAAAGVPVHSSTRHLGGSSTWFGFSIKAVPPKTLTGSVSSSATFTKITGRVRSMAGSLTPAGVKSFRALHARAGTVSSTGVMVRRGRKPVAGVIATVGSLFSSMFNRIYGRAGTAKLTVSAAATAELVTYQRHRAQLTVWTIADALLDGQDRRHATGAPTRTRVSPGAPTAVTARPGNMQAVVSFAAPADDGGAPVIAYTVYSSTGQTATGEESPITVSGLANGTTVTFIVTASNVVGDSVASEVSAPVTPVAGVPEQPRNVVLTPANGQVVVTFTQPANTGGSPITSYTVNLSNGMTKTVTGSPTTMGGLVNGTAYTATVSATNAIGTSPPSERSAAVTPATVPTAPTIGTPVAGSGQATVNWSAPVSNGGSPVTSYTITAYVGVGSTVAKTVTAAASATSVAVTGLNNGTTYSFAVTATNPAGTSSASARSSTVTPAAPGITTRTASTSSSANATSNLVLPRPSGVAAGDLLVATFSTNGALVNSAPSGWTLIGHADVGNPKVYAYYKVATTGDVTASSYTWSLASSAGYGGGIQAYVGVHQTTPLDVAAVTAVNTSASTASISAAITPVTANGLLVATAGPNSSVVHITPPTGWAEDFDVAVSGAKVNSHSHYAYSAATGGTYTWRPDEPRAIGVVLFALRHA